MHGSDSDLFAWDNVAEAYAARVGDGSDPIFQRFHDFLWRHLGDDLAGLQVLDLGCGHGWLAAAYRARGAAVVGVDGSEVLLTSLAPGSQTSSSFTPTSPPSSRDRSGRGGSTA